MTCHQPVGQAAVLSDVPHPYPLMPPERGIWWLSGTNLGPVHMSSCAIVCSRLSLSFQEYFARDYSCFICNPQCPLTPLATPDGCLASQYRHLVVKSGTTAGQHNMSSACGSGCCFVRCTPPHIPPQCLPERHLVAKSGSNLGPVHMSPCAIVCNRLSFQEYFARDCIHVSYVTPHCPQHPLATPDGPTSTPPSVQASSGQDWYYCRSA